MILKDDVVAMQDLGKDDIPCCLLIEFCERLGSMNDCHPTTTCRRTDRSPSHFRVQRQKLVKVVHNTLSRMTHCHFIEHSWELFAHKFCFNAEYHRTTQCVVLVLHYTEYMLLVLLGFTHNVDDLAIQQKVPHQFSLTAHFVTLSFPPPSQFPFSLYEFTVTILRECIINSANGGYE